MLNEQRLLTAAADGKKKILGYAKQHFQTFAGQAPRDFLQAARLVVDEARTEALFYCL